MTETMLDRLEGLLRQIALENGVGRHAHDMHDDAVRLLRAMREPARGMAEAGAEVIPGDEPADHAEVANDVWRAMIDEALDSYFAGHPTDREIERPGRQKPAASHDDEDVTF